MNKDYELKPLTPADIKITIKDTDSPESETEQIMCEHCKIPHSCTLEYRLKYKDKGWMCGLCYCAYLGITMRTQCPDHAVPEFNKQQDIGK